MKTEIFEKYQNALENAIKIIYPKIIKGKKTPKVLITFAKNLLVEKPNCLFFKVIEIKEYYEKPVEALDKCFPSNYYLEEDKAFKGKIYKFLSDNIKRFEDDLFICEEIKKIIGELDNNSTIKKYINLIKIISNKMDKQDDIVCELLASCPYKYKELVYVIDQKLHLSILPEEASDFYALKNYKDNEIKFKEYITNRYNPLLELKTELLKKLDDQSKEMEKQATEISTLSGIVRSQSAKIDNLEKTTSELKNSLFQIQMRDVVSAFLDQMTWTFPVEKNNILPSMETTLINIVGHKNKAVEMILNIVANALNYKDQGNDLGHTVKNIGFNSLMLPDFIKNKYDDYQTEPNCSIANCDCIALLLSVKEINDCSPEVTKKNYKLFKDIIDLGTKDWEKRRKKMKSYLIDYEQKF